MHSFQEQQLTALITFFYENTRPDLLTKQKLMCLLFLFNITCLKKIAWVSLFVFFLKTSKGPVSHEILRFLARKKLLDKNNKIIPMPKNDYGTLSQNDVEFLTKICLQYKDKDDNEMLKEVEKEIPYRLTEEADEISYLLTAQDPDCLADEEEIRTCFELYS